MLTFPHSSLQRLIDVAVIFLFKRTHDVRSCSGVFVAQNVALLIVMLLFVLDLAKTASFIDLLIFPFSHRQDVSDCHVFAFQADSRLELFQYAFYFSN